MHAHMQYRLKSHHAENEPKGTFFFIYVLLICSCAHTVFMRAKPLLTGREESVAQTES